MNEEQRDNPRGALSGVFIATISAVVSASFFILFFYMAYTKGKHLGPPQLVILQLTAVLVTVGMTQFLFRQIQGNKLLYRQGFLGGWMSSLILGIFVAFFYNIFSKKSGIALPSASFAMVLILYNLLGLIISLILAFVFRKN
ncbi:MAG: hypothetical protein JWN78_1987 [Bacteroidota bacterium]|nr:hypothetical protein [Bacteroidota bacterium]